ncbi:MAG: 4Fe-4S binding protein [Marinilabiliales bacterium]|nr:4Fe-4S binding protein [Marinilabiliales bacterium]
MDCGECFKVCPVRAVSN